MPDDAAIEANVCQIEGMSIAGQHAGGDKSKNDDDNLPPHRSHDPKNNLKRTDPFQFGSRFLQEDDDVFEFNAWDHVETDETYKEHAELQYTKQRASPVSDWDKKRFNTDPVKWWNLFYKNNTSNFFKNRKWLAQEFPIIASITKPDAGPTVLLEVGAGAGNTAFPILSQNANPLLRIHACDFSKKAVELIRDNPSYGPSSSVTTEILANENTTYAPATENNAQSPKVGSIQADVWDVADEQDRLPPGIEPGTVDVVMMIFIFSALSPAQWRQAVRNVHLALKPGGQVLFRDYGRGDLAQVRFKKGRYMEENFYVRGDGTRVYFFDKDELAQIWRDDYDDLSYDKLPGGDGGGDCDDDNDGDGGGDDNGGGAERGGGAKVGGGDGNGDIDAVPTAASATATTTTTTATTSPATTMSSVSAETTRTAADSESTNNNDGKKQTSASGQKRSPAASFDVVNLGVDRRLLINRQRKLKMYRCWLQGRFVKRDIGT
ncbi:MAG: hypothetical protein M1825_000160 [Sarcosagium campestre]|nr:MAG: hypothetical protein M1825_000160 [Sarcosagium campestre]